MDANYRIDGEKVFLTPMTLDDAEIFVKWRNSEFVMSRFLIREPFTVEGQRAWITNKVMTGDVVQFVIWDKKDNIKIGSIYLINIDKQLKECEYGILIGEPSYTGGGRGTEAIDYIVQYAFEELGMKKIYCRILADNMASINSSKNNGFVEERIDKGSIVVDGLPKDVVFLAKNR